MFNYLIKGILSVVALKLIANCRQLSVQLLKIEVAKSYVHGVRAVRLSVAGLAGLALVVGLICLGLLLSHAALFILLPWGVKAKAALGLCLGLAYVALGVAALRAALDERRWMEKSGAGELLRDALRDAKKG